MYIKEKKDAYNTEYLNLLRWSATIAVVLIHVIAADSSICDRAPVLFAFRNLLNWCVPIFVMISGVLFLNPNKEVSIRKLIKKYIMRIVLALFTFGTVYAWLEIIFNEKTININQIFLAIYNVILGKTWSVMWYLYMIIGLYLITPMIKNFLKNADDKTIEYIIVIMFIFNSIIPTISTLFNININFYTPITSVYLLYYLLGYYIHYRNPVKIKSTLLYIGTILSICIIILTSILVKSKSSLVIYNYSSPIIVIFSCCIFYIGKNVNLKYRFKNSYLCFGIYLIHCFYINIFFKFFNIGLFNAPVVYIIPLISIVVLLLSVTSSYLLNRIKILNKYIL